MRTGGEPEEGCNTVCTALRFFHMCTNILQRRLHPYRVGTEYIALVPSIAVVLVCPTCRSKLGRPTVEIARGEGKAKASDVHLFGARNGTASGSIYTQRNYECSGDTSIYCVSFVAGIIYELCRTEKTEKIKEGPAVLVI